MNPNPVEKNKRQDTLLSRKKSVERVITAISQNLDEPMTMMDMAQLAHTSPFHFNRIFHEVTGLPPTQFLYALRLESAKRLLLTTERSVTDICYAVGYNSLGTFTSRFTELVGLSPREFRNLAAKMRLFDWENFYSEGWRVLSAEPAQPYLEGKLVAPENFEGLIFIGLFEKMIPQSIPKVGTLLIREGVFRLGPLTEGECHLLVAALPRAEDPQDYILLDLSKILVGISETLQFSQNGLVKEKPEIHLRPFQITDPPILLSLPSLLTSAMNEITSR